MNENNNQDLQNEQIYDQLDGILAE